MICNEYQAERIEFCRKINEVIVPFESFKSQEQFLFLMSTNDIKVLMPLVYFIDKCLQICHFMSSVKILY